MSDKNLLTPQLTADGSFTFFSDEFNEQFHSNSGAKQEAEAKFVEPCQLAQKAKINSSLQLLDICYGLGYNSAAALDKIWSSNSNCFVELIALEIEPAIATHAITNQLLNSWTQPIPQWLETLAKTDQIQTSQLHAQLLIGDARNTIKQVYQSGFKADAIFLDSFSPPKCPQLWTVEFLSLVARCLKPSGRLATYSCAASVRTALNVAGLSVGSTLSIGRRSPGTVAILSNQGLRPLSDQEQEHLQTRAAIPYRDPQLNALAADILRYRQQEQQTSLLEPTSHWKKRWQRRSP